MAIFIDIMRKMNRKWAKEEIEKESLKYNTRGQFDSHNPNAYNAARRLGIVDEVCSHMAPKQKKWTLEEMQAEALKYKTRQEFNKNSPAYTAAYKKGLLDKICQHMVWILKPWTIEEIKQEALKYNSRQEFNKNSTAYRAALKRGIIDEVCSHMDIPLRIWNLDEIKEEALKFNSRKEFSKNSPAYQSALKRGFLNQVCAHMKIIGGISVSEKELFNEIKMLFPKAQKLVDRKVKIKNKPHIKGLDVDIYIPELRKGIEFDGTYWHSVDGLKRSRKNWPENDLENYHEIKDDYFKSKGIELLHIKEEDWISNQEQQINRCMEFLSVKNEFNRAFKCV